MSETKGLFPKDKNQEIRLMLEKLSFNQLKLVRNLKLRKPWKEFLKELIPFNGVSNFLRGRPFMGIISAIIIPILSENMPKKIFNEVLSCLFVALGAILKNS